MIAIRLVVAAGVAVAWASGFAQDLRELAFHVVHPVGDRPVIDGALDDACWKRAACHDAYYEYFKEDARRIPEALRTESYLLYDDKGVYLGVRNREPLVKQLKKGHIKNYDTGIWTDDSAEVYFDPAAAGVGYYRFVVNCIGKITMAFRMDGANLDETWKCPGVEAAAKIFDDRWEFELFVPYAGLDNHAPAKPGDVWMFNHSRMRWAEKAWTDFWCSSPMASGSSANRFGYMYFSDGKSVPPEKVLELLAERQHTKWAIQIGERTYCHQLDGIHEMKETISEYMARHKRESAALDALCTTNIQRLVKEPDYRAEPLALPLAGTYDLTPPKEFDGHNGWFRHNTVRGAYVTPHLVWARKLIGKAPHPLYVTPANALWRDAIETDQRFAFDDPLYHPGGFGASGIYEDPVSLGTHMDKQKQFETLLAGNPDVICLARWSMKDIPVKYRYEILRRVRDEGVGLVVMPRWSSWDFPYDLRRDAEAERALARRLPFCSIPGQKDVPPWTLRDGSLPTARDLRVMRFGKGLVVGYPVNDPAAWTPGWMAGYEARQAFLFGLVRTAQGVRPATDVDFGRGTDETLDAGASDALSFAVTVRDAGADRVTYRVRSDLNETLAEETCALRPGANRIFVDISALPAGAYWVDVIPMKGERCDLPAFRRFTRKSPLGPVTIDGTNASFVAENRAPRLGVTWPRALPTSGTLAWEIRSLPYKETVMKGEIPLKRGATKAEIRGNEGPFPTRMGLVDLTVRDADGAPLVRAHKTVAFPNHRYPDYTTIMWGDPAGCNMGELFAPQIVDWMGYDGFIEGRGARLAPFNAWSVPTICRVELPGGTNGTSWSGYTIPYPWNKGGREAAKRNWNEKYKGRYNLDDPEVLELVTETLRQRGDLDAKYVPLVWNLGDECWYSKNLGFGTDYINGLYTQWLEKRYGTLERLNASYKSNYGSWKEIPHLTTEQALKANNLPAWYDTILYSDHYYARVMRKVRGILKTMDPPGRVGAEGSSAGDLAETVRDLEFWGPYRSLVADERLKSLKPQAIRGTWWGGYVRASRNGFPTDQWEYLLTGTINADEWFMGNPGNTESAFAGDLQPAPYVKRQHDYHLQLKRGLASLLIRTPFRRNNFIFHANHASELLSTRGDEFPGAGKLNELVRFCYRRGYDVAFSEPTTVDRIFEKKVAFLMGQCALSDDEVRKFQEFVRRGGRIVADCEPGVADQYLALRKEPPLKGKWTPLAANWTPEDVQAVLDPIGDRPVEKLAGIDMRHTILRTRVRTFAGEAAKAFGGTMKITGFKTTADKVGTSLAFDFGAEGYVYETDAGYVGKCAKVDLANLEKPFKVYSIFEVEQKAPVFEIPTTVAPGDRVTFETKSLRPDSTYRLMVCGLDGKEIANRAQVFVADAKTKKVEFQFPFSDRPGTYKVVLRDIATGLETATAVMVRSVLPAVL